MATNALDIFRLTLRAAVSPNSSRGELITKKELQGALRPLVFRGNMTVDRDDFRAAREVLSGAAFRSRATGLAQETADAFLTQFDGRWSPSSSPAPDSGRAFVPGRLYSLPRSSLPTPPHGHSWHLHGLDLSKPGHVFAKLVEEG